MRGFAAKRDATPDYSETLGKIAPLLDKMRDAINTLARRPAMQLTPDTMTQQIAAAGAKARAEDGAVIQQARERIDGAAHHMERLAGTIATAREQRRRRVWAAGGGLLVGVLLWSILPGVALRILPQSWHIPEDMARHIIGEPTLWEAGTRLVQADSLQAWNALTEAVELARENSDAISACHKAAAEADRPMRCTISVKAPRKR